MAAGTNGDRNKRAKQQRRRSCSSYLLHVGIPLYTYTVAVVVVVVVAATHSINLKIIPRSGIIYYYHRRHYYYTIIVARPVEENAIIVI